MVAISMIAALAIGMIGPANAGACFKVDADNMPTVTLKGEVVKAPKRADFMGALVLWGNVALYRGCLDAVRLFPDARGVEFAGARLIPVDPVNHDLLAVA